MKLETIKIGQIVNAHGIRGEVRIQPRDGDTAFLTKFNTFLLDGRPISPTVLAGRSRAVPRHPAWTAPTDLVTGSWSSRMMQSAEKTIRLSPGSPVTRASAV